MFSLKLFVTYFMKFFPTASDLRRTDPPRPPRVVAQAAESSHRLGGRRYTAAAARDQACIARKLAQGVEFSTPLTPRNLQYELLEYAMTLYLGTPAQKFVLTIDTGNELVWVQYKPCTSPNKCYQEADPFFDPSASSSYSPVSCNSTQTYGPQQVSYNTVSLF
jgi:hypothetical protein